MPSAYLHLESERIGCRSIFLLVNPLYLSKDPVEQRLMTPYFPLGLLYLAATLRDGGIQRGDL